MKSQKLALVVGLAISALACAQDDTIRFSVFEIPIDSVLHHPRESLDGLLDSNDPPIALVIKELEIVSKVDGYQGGFGSRGELGLLLYPNPLDIRRLSETLLPSYKEMGRRTTPDEYLPDYISYGGDKDWVLTSVQEGTETVFAVCTKSGLNGQVTRCTFRTNIGAHGINFSLRDGNISLATEVQAYIEEKLKGWKVEKEVGVEPQFPDVARNVTKTIAMRYEV